MLLRGTLGFLGFGNMGSAILQGLIESQIIAGKHAVVHDPEASRRDLAQHLGAAVVESPEALARVSDTLLLAVKPQTMDLALQQMKPALREETLLISIAAGLSIAWFQERVGTAMRIIRVMPNTPAMCHAGAAGIALGPGCTGDDAATARGIFEAVGIAEVVEEAQMDAVTAVSGSGPAYFFRMVECLARAGMAEGLSEPVAMRLAAQTLIGAGRLLGASGESAPDLRAKVTSKGGTTEAALRQFEADGLAELVQHAVSAAAARSRELGRSS